jgi:hypothetical protein
LQYFFSHPFCSTTVRPRPPVTLFYDSITSFACHLVLRQCGLVCRSLCSTTVRRRSPVTLFYDSAASSAYNFVLQLYGLVRLSPLFYDSTTSFACHLVLRLCGLVRLSLCSTTVQLRSPVTWLHDSVASSEYNCVLQLYGLVRLSPFFWTAWPLNSACRLVLHCPKNILRFVTVLNLP